MTEYLETEEEYQARFEAARAQMPPGTEPKLIQRKRVEDPKLKAAYRAQASLYLYGRN